MAGLNSKMDTTEKMQERDEEKALEKALEATPARAEDLKKALATSKAKGQPMEVDMGGAAASSSSQKLLASGYKIDSWPTPPCDVCSVVGDSHKRMSQVRSWVPVLDDEGAEDEDESFYMITDPPLTLPTLCSV